MFRDVLGFHARLDGQSAAVLSAAEGMPPLVVLLAQPGLRPRPSGTTGLFHVAIRLPDRPSLARVGLRLLHYGYPLHGAAHHGVSEALYLADPDGNGIELYRDLPRTLWREADGTLEMTTDALDLQELLREAGARNGDPAPLDARADIGHVHLSVSSLERSEAFYAGLLGLQVRQRTYPGALFLAADGYHHHIGLNVWSGVGAPRPPADSAGLESFTFQCSTGDEWEHLRTRLADAGLLTSGRLPVPGDSPITVADPDGILVRLESSVHSS